MNDDADADDDVDDYDGNGKLGARVQKFFAERKKKRRISYFTSI